MFVLPDNYCAVALCCYISVFYIFIKTLDQRHHKRRGAAVFEDTDQRTSVVGANGCIDGRCENAPWLVQCFVNVLWHSLLVVAEFTLRRVVHC